MDDKNPYASPTPLEEVASKTASLVPQSFGQAARQGVRLGFKWGNRVGLTFCGLSFLALVGITILRAAKGLPVLSDLRISLELLKGLGMFLLLYGYICLLSVTFAVVICMTAHGVRKGWRALRHR